MTEQEREEKARADVDTYGCHVLKILGDDEGPPFAYSIGIGMTSNQPDLLVVGLDLDVAHRIINDYNRRVRAGETFAVNVPHDGFLDDCPVVFGRLLKHHYREYLGWGIWFYGGTDFEVLQAFYTDRRGTWPWDPGASDEIRWVLPVLCERPALT